MNHSSIERGGNGVIGTSLSPLDAGQLTMIARLVGPAGVRTIESALLGCVKDHVHVIKSVLAKHLTTFESLPADLANDEQLKLAAKELHPAITTLFQSLGRLGDALVLRRLLVDALARVQSEVAPMLPWIGNMAAAIVGTFVRQLASQTDGSAIAGLYGEPEATAERTGLLYALWDRLSVSGTRSCLVRNNCDRCCCESQPDVECDPRAMLASYPRWYLEPD